MDQTGTTTSAVALDAVRVEFERLTASAGWACSLGELRDDVGQAVALKALAESMYLAALARLDVAETAAAPGARRAPYATVNALVDRFRLDQAAASADVRAARAFYGTEPALPELADALAQGQITRRHVDEAVKVFEQVPAEVLDAKDETTGLTGAQTVDGFLTDTARALTPRQTAGAGRALIGRLTPERDDTKDRSTDTRRAFTLGVAADGCGLFRGVVPPSDVPWFSALAQQWAKVAPDGVGVDEDGQEALFPDTRTAAQRRYDGLAATLRAGLAAGGSDADGPSPDVTVFVTATVDDLTSDGPTSATVDGLGAITRPTLNRLACIATLHRVLVGSAGQVLDLGRAVRLATGAQRKALLVRDGGCIIPGCTSPGAACDVHHVIHWSNGGPTDLNNQTLVCPRHHTEIHLGLHDITIRDGIPWVTGRGWYTPDRHPRRNPRHHHDHEARRLGDQLRISADHRSADPDPP